jgi:hypothetical protein
MHARVRQHGGGEGDLVTAPFWIRLVYSNERTKAQGGRRPTRGLSDANPGRVDSGGIANTMVRDLFALCTMNMWTPTPEKEPPACRK